MKSTAKEVRVLAEAADNPDVGVHVGTHGFSWVGVESENAKRGLA